MNIVTEMYVLKNKIYNLPFFGIINYEFKREGYYVNKYSNGDDYFGYYSNDLRNKQEIYIYKQKYEIKNTLLMEYYLGIWENDLNERRGIYLWPKKNRDNYNKNMPINKIYNLSNNCETVNICISRNFSKK